MKDFIIKDDWKIIENEYNPAHNQISESLLSLGNGKMGQRANYEEQYSGPSLQGSYVAGIYYPDKTRVGWWKNGYPEYFAKVLNSCNWIGIDVNIGGESLDLAKVKSIHSFHRALDMKTGMLSRSMDVTLQNDAKIEVTSHRINSMANDELGVISYTIKVKDYNGKISLSPYLDFNIRNKDSNYDEVFWNHGEQDINQIAGYVSATTKKTGFQVGVAMTCKLLFNDLEITDTKNEQRQEASVRWTFDLDVKSGDTITLEKFVSVKSSLYYAEDTIKDNAIHTAIIASENKADYHFQQHAESWKAIWELCDVIIEGDISAQQGIRFNIFQLYQTYTGKDPRLNIGPKGFTGEKYGGSTYWDTEAYCLPFYLGTASQEVARNLLVYRHNHLAKAIENAEKLGFTNGAALYPMVTMNGEECHNEWEITFEEIHRNGAIAYAIYDYIRYTGDSDYLLEYGIDVLVGISRFWAQRVNWSDRKSMYVMLGVTGPNEYENNVNNNWYTNYIAKWCLQYTLESIHSIAASHPLLSESLNKKLKLTSDETQHWQEIIDKIYLPEDQELGIFLQQDNYLDKEQILVKDLDPKDRPLNQKWSWDRILRSCFIKQADVLQGLYFFEEDFSDAQHRSNFLFYEPRTVHESSLSPCVHSILATKLGMHDKAYEMYLRTSRLDLDDYNNDTEDGCHITSMAGTWLSIVKGFGGQRIVGDMLSIAPNLPQQWQSLSFKLKHRDNLLEIKIGKQKTKISNLEGPDCNILLLGKQSLIPSNESYLF